MRRLVVSTLVLVLVVRDGAAVRAAETAEVVARTRASAVVVRSQISGDLQAIGAGVVVALDRYAVRVVTARHVVAYGAVTVVLDGRDYAGEVVRTFAHRDLAVVEALVPDAAARGVRAADVGTTASGAILHVWGEDDAGPRLAHGRLTTVALASIDDRDAPPLLALTCDDCRRGDSGGGIFDTAGRLVGILVARYRTRDDATVAIVGEAVDVVATR